jgi:hypothetical protein
MEQMNSYFARRDLFHAKTQRRKDAKTQRRKDAKTRRRKDAKTRRHEEDREAQPVCLAFTISSRRWRPLIIRKRPAAGDRGGLCVFASSRETTGLMSEAPGILLQRRQAGMAADELGDFVVDGESDLEQEGGTSGDRYAPVTGTSGDRYVPVTEEPMKMDQTNSYFAREDFL